MLQGQPLRKALFLYQCVTRWVWTSQFCNMKNNLKSIFISHWVKHQRYDTELDSRTEWMKYVALATAEENLYELVPHVPKSNIIWHCHSCIMVSLHYLARWFTFKHINCWWLKYKQTFSERFSWWTCLTPKCKLIFFSIFFSFKKTVK